CATVSAPAGVSTRSLHDALPILRRRWAREVKDAQVVVFGASPIPGLSVAGGFKVVIEDRGGLGVQNLQTQTDRLIGKLREAPGLDRKSTRLNSSHRTISYAVFCL